MTTKLSALESHFRHNTRLDDWRLRLPSNKHEIGPDPDLISSSLLVHFDLSLSIAINQYNI